jgi:hypothetical protein
MAASTQSVLETGSPARCKNYAGQGKPSAILAEPNVPIGVDELFWQVKQAGYVTCNESTVMASRCRQAPAPGIAITETIFARQ